MNNTINRKCVFKVITGSYDELMEPKVKTPGYDYICITDNPFLVSENWKIVRISEKHEMIECPKKRANAVMMDYRDYLSDEYELCIYTDGNVLVKENLNTFLKTMGYDTKSYDMMIGNHIDRCCIYKESQEIILLNKDSRKNVQEHMHTIMKDRYPRNNGLYETNTIVFNPKSEKLFEFFQYWRDLYLKMPCKRDQLSINYALWKLNNGLRILAHSALQPKTSGNPTNRKKRKFHDFLEVVPYHSKKKMPKEKVNFIIFENTPFRSDKNLVRAYNSFMELLPENGWALFRDADTLLLDPFYGEVFERAIQNNPEVGCFTCLTNRIGNKTQQIGEYSGDDIVRHKEIALEIKNQNYNKYEDFPFSIEKGTTLSGMVILLSKDAWKKIGGFKRSTIFGHIKDNKNSNILGVDNQLHKDLSASGIPLKIIKEMYIYHWYRGGDKTKKDHLNPNTKYVHTPPPKNDIKEQKKSASLSNTKKFIERRRKK